MLKVFDLRTLLKMEALERRGKILAAFAIFFIILWSQCKEVEGHKNSTKMSYVCPPQFIRLGHSCYYFSETKTTWQNALFACKDRDSNLTVPARWEDRNLREYLSNPDIERTERWIGGIYDYQAQAWKWGGELKEMRYQSFSKMQKLRPENLMWHCISMVPDLLYRWAPRKCVDPRQYICQTKLRKIPKSKVKEFRKRWRKMGKINEITAPSVSGELSGTRYDVTVNPLKNPKSYDLRPSPLRLPPKYGRHPNVIGNSLRPNDHKKRAHKVGRPSIKRRLRPPFPGYSWNRSDPIASYKYNAELLNSGRTGLSPHLVGTHLRRLQRVRDKQLYRRNSLAQTKARTYTMDNNISALHPKTIVEEFDIPTNPPPIEVYHPVRGTG